MMGCVARDLVNREQEFPISISIERNSASYEGGSFLQIAIDGFVLNTLAHLEPIGTFFFLLSKDCRIIRRYATTYKALEKIYTYRWDNNKGIIDRVATHVWLNILNGKSVRNRLKLVEKELKDAILSFDKEEVNVVSLGSGSGRAVIKVVAQLKEQGIKVKAKLVDRSRGALICSRKLAETYGVGERMTYLRSKIEDLIPDNCRDFPPDIIEMVGLMDYLHLENAVEVIHKIHSSLVPGGILITANIRNNPEDFFVTRVIQWPMIYREPEELGEILVRGGFDPRNIRVVYEPLGIHGLAIGKKFA